MIIDVALVTATESATLHVDCSGSITKCSGFVYFFGLYSSFRMVESFGIVTIDALELFWRDCIFQPF